MQQRSTNTRKRHRSGAVIAVCLLSGLVSVVTAALEVQDVPSPLVIYLDDGPYIVRPETRDQSPYLPLTELVRRLALPYTDATATGQFTIRGPARTLVLERDTGQMQLDDRDLDLESPVLNEDGRWLVPVDLLVRGLGPAMGLTFEQTGSRIIASNVERTSLEMSAAAPGGVTRITLRLGASANIRVQQEPERNLVTLNVDRAPLLPNRDSLEYRDNAVRSVRFDDTDGRSRIVIETTPQVVNVRLVPGDENRTFYLELVPATTPVETVAAAPPPGGVEAPTDPVDSLISDPLRVLVIDPGHGGLDGGTGAGGVLEKDLTLALARRLRATLEERLNASVILTRERDQDLTVEGRVALANQNRADLMISLHIGFSPDPTESLATVFVMKEFTPAPIGTARGDFLPWYEVWRGSRQTSLAFAAILERGLRARIPEWPLSIREAPLGVLASTSMPAVVAELGNANNPQDLERLGNPMFQNRIIDALVESIQAASVEVPPGEED